MWSYDPALKQFTWIKGSNEVGLSVGYSVGEKGKFEASNEITPRQYMTSCVLGDSFYIFGGKGNNETLIRTLHLSDLWKYNVTTNMVRAHEHVSNFAFIYFSGVGFLANGTKTMIFLLTVLMGTSLVISVLLFESLQR